MRTSSFKLVKVGGGYWRTLWNLWRKLMFGSGPYASLDTSRTVRRTVRGDQYDGSLPRVTAEILR
jgi:hypothetical protein